MSSPRREWWSLPCSRRCSVRWLMRSVSSAIWTFVEPVSFSFAPNRAAISRLRSLAIAVIGAERLADSRLPSVRVHGDQLARALDVAAHLLDERVGGVEAPLAAQSRKEVQAQLAAVQVALEVEQVGLDQLAAAGLEGGTDADAHGRRPPAGQTRVHAVPGTCVGLLGNQVGGGKAERAPAVVAPRHLAAEPKRRPQQAACLGHVPSQQQATDVAGGDDLAVDLEQRVHERGEALVGSEQAG